MLCQVYKVISVRNLASQQFFRYCRFWPMKELRCSVWKGKKMDYPKISCIGLLGHYSLNGFSGASQG